MKKKLLMIVFLTIFVLIGSRAFIALFSYQIIEKIKRENHDIMSITYVWISSSFDGSIEFHDLTITPYGLKRTYSVERISLRYSNYIDLITNLPKLKLGDLSKISGVEFENIKSPLKGRDLDEWLALEVHADLVWPLGLYGCGNEERISHESLEKMGITELQADVKLSIDESANPSAPLLKADIDLYQLGKLDIETDVKINDIPSLISQFNVQDIELRHLSLGHQEQGYFRRLGNYCSELTGVTREEYSQIAGALWRAKMASIGIVVNEDAEALYRDYLSKGGRLTVNFELPNQLKHSSESDLLDNNLVNYFGMSAYLNGDLARELDIQASRLHFRPVKDTVQLDPRFSQQKAEQNRAPAFHVTKLENLEYFVGRPGIVTLKNGKVSRGKLHKTSKSAIYLSQLVQGGSVDYAFKFVDIEHVEVWRTEGQLETIKSVEN